MHEEKRLPLKIAAVYTAVAGLWIFFTDRLLAGAASDPALLTRLQTIKGLLFITVTAGMLYWLVRRSLAQVSHSRDHLQDARYAFEALFLASPLAVIAVDRDGNVISWNPAAERIFGWRAGEVIGRPLPIVPSDKQDEFRSLRMRVLNGERFENIKLRRRRKDGSAVDISLSTAPLREAKGDIFGIMAIIADITEHKKMEESLIKSETRLRAIIEAEPECIMLVTEDGALLDMNPAGLRMIEADSLAQVLGKSMYPLLLPEYRRAFRSLMENVFKGESCALEFEFMSLKGARVWVESSAVPLRNSSGEITSLLAVTRDVTERKKLEDQLLHAQKMEAIGTLTSGIAHDFNNILTAIIGYANILKMKLRDDDPLRTYALQILGSTERATALTLSLLTFGRKQTISVQSVNLNDIIRRVGKILTRVIGEDIKLTMRLTDADVTVMGDSGQIEQVMMNLAANARDAMPEGGILDIVTDAVHLGGEYIKMHGYGKAGRYALITMGDTGVGMDQNTQRRIFEPFFTTKEVGRGTGLGLSIVYGLVKQHNGFINVYSEPDVGTTFKIYLPHSARTAETDKPETSDLLEGGRETILIAEDEADVREITTSILEQFGYTVIQAENGEDAVSRFMEHKDRVQLLLFDVIMPKKTGREAYEEINKISPGIKTIFMSGYTMNIVQTKGIIENGHPFISKPISPGDILKKIREVLDR